MARNQEGDHLIPDILVAQPLAGLRVRGIQHGAEDSLLACGISLLLALRNQLVRDLVHQANISVALVAGHQHQAILQRQPPRTRPIRRVPVPSRRQRGACHFRKGC